MDEVRRLTPIVRGPKGPQGEKGLDGKHGKEGAAGTLGKNGSNGEKGALGERGFRGPQGVKGKQGGLGPQGISGMQGTIGKRGSTGTSGKKGTPGEKGLPGKSGKNGESFRVAKLSSLDVSRLQDRILKKVVLDIDLEETMSETKLVIKYTDGTKKSLSIDTGSDIAIMTPRTQTNITEEVLSPEDSANLATTAEKLEELVRNQQNQLDKVTTELGQIRTHMSLVTGEELKQTDVAQDEEL